MLEQTLNYLFPPRGIRNNNPGNIRRGEKWAGLREVQTDKLYCQFIKPEYGIRAITKILNTYQRRYLISTIADIISRWAPPSENKTQTYINFVVTYTNIPPQQILDLKEKSILIPIIKAITKFENGVQPYSDDLVGLGIDLALL